MKNKWSLVPQAVSQTSASIWVGSLFEDNFKPDLCYIELTNGDTGQVVSTKHIRFDDWQRPFSAINKRFFHVVNFESLIANTKYNVHLIRSAQSLYGKQLPQRTLSRGEVTTLPSRLNSTTPWVIATGSCYYNEEDEGFVSNAFHALCQHPDTSLRPSCKFFTGDQVYLDIGIDSLTRNAREVPNRIANDYALTWQQQRRMYRSGANWFLADDHEYWNNYPCLSGTNPYLWMIMGCDKVRRAWQKAAKDGVRNIQHISPVKTFNIGNDLSFCVVDFRSDRKVTQHHKRLMKSTDFNAVIEWAESLTSPGVLVSPQPLVVKPGDDSMDLSLANFTNDYSRLLTALASTGQDIVCLSGDVHFGRVAQVEQFGENGAKLIEVISSPLSNLTGLDGKVAAEKPKKLTKFPAIEIAAVQSTKVSYEKPWAVSTKKTGNWPLDYTKTKEHFMTLAFVHDTEQNIQLTIRAWLVNEQNKSGMPKLNFTKVLSLRKDT